MKFLNCFLVPVIFLFTTSVTQSDIHIITLNVDTSQINGSNIREVCYFSPEQAVEIEEYNTEVNIGDLVLWKGISTSDPENDRVEITSINYEGGERVFNRNTLRDSPSAVGIVSGTVSKGKKGNFSKYKVSFRVYQNANRLPGLFHIDPKITIRQ